MTLDHAGVSLVKASLSSKKAVDSKEKMRGGCQDAQVASVGSATHAHVLTETADFVIV